MPDDGSIDACIVSRCRDILPVERSFGRISVDKSVGKLSFAEFFLISSNDALPPGPFRANNNLLTFFLSRYEAQP